jgi:GTPase KRas protein
VYSITSRESFVRVGALRDAMLGVPAAVREGGGADEMGGVAHERVRARPIQIVLVGNKSDWRVGREVSAKEGAELAESLGCSFVETSAKEGYNIDKAFHDLVRTVDAADKEAKDDKGPMAVGGFRGRLGHLARSLRLKKT